MEIKLVLHREPTLDKLSTGPRAGWVVVVSSSPVSSVCWMPPWAPGTCPAAKTLCADAGEGFSSDEHAMPLTHS